MTVEDYLAEIRKCEDSIYSYQCQIRDLNARIAELQQYAQKFTDVGTAIQNASSNSISKFRSIIDSFISVGKQISNIFYENNTAIFSGSEYQKACSATQDAVDSAYRKIDGYNGQIDWMYVQINSLNQRIGEFRAAITLLESTDGGGN